MEITKILDDLVKKYIKEVEEIKIPSTDIALISKQRANGYALRGKIMVLLEILAMLRK
jgi:hypothetical protein